MKTFKKIELIFFALVTIVIGLSYGIVPEVAMEKIYGITYTGDMGYMLRALCGLYIGLSFFWIYTGVTNKFRWGFIVQLFYEIGLITGRTISILVDGAPQNFVLHSFLYGEIGVLIMLIFLLRHENKRLA